MIFTNIIIIIIMDLYNKGLYRLVNITYLADVKKIFGCLDHQSGVVFEFSSNLAAKVTARRLGFIKEKMGQTAAVRGTEARQRQDGPPGLRMNCRPLMFTSDLIIGVPDFAEL